MNLNDPDTKDCVFHSSSFFVYHTIGWNYLLDSKVLGNIHETWRQGHRLNFPILLNLANRYRCPLVLSWRKSCFPEGWFCVLIPGQLTSKDRPCNKQQTPYRYCNPSLCSCPREGAKAALNSAEYGVSYQQNGHWETLLRVLEGTKTGEVARLEYASYLANWEKIYGLSSHHGHTEWLSTTLLAVNKAFPITITKMS